jgi:hypothetical protein
MAILYSNADATESSLVLIESIVVAPAVASVTFSAIPQTYKHLKLFASVRSAVVSKYDSAFAQFNGDTGANYWYASHNGGSAHSVYNTSGVTWAVLCAATGNSSDADIFAGSEATIFDYTGSSKKIVSKMVREAHTSTDLYGNQSITVWQNTAAITSILLWANGGNLMAGSRFDLYGIK